VSILSFIALDTSDVLLSIQNAINSIIGLTTYCDFFYIFFYGVIIQFVLVGFVVRLPVTLNDFHLCSSLLKIFRF
jgi:hypothetical protein